MSSTSSLGRWASNLINSTSNKCFPLRNGLKKCSLNPYSGSCSVMKLLPFNLISKKLKNPPLTLKLSHKISSTWSNMLKMPVGPLLSFISFWTPWTTTQTLSPLIPTLPSSKMNAQPRIQKRREKFSKATNKSKGNTNQPVKKDSPKFNQKLTLTSSPSFRKRALYGNLMGWKNVQSIMVPAHPRNLLTKAVLSFKSLWQETQITWTSRWLLSPRMQHDKNNEYRISYSISRNQNIIVSIDSFTGSLLAQYLFLGIIHHFQSFCSF